MLLLEQRFSLYGDASYALLNAACCGPIIIIAACLAASIVSVTSLLALNTAVYLRLVGARACEPHEGVLISVTLLQRLRHLTDLRLPCDPCQLSSLLLILSQLSLYKRAI